MIPSDLTTFEHTTGSYPVAVLRSDRKQAAVTVHPAMCITVRLPLDATDQDAITLLSRRRAWISQQLDQFNEYRPITPSRQYISGETHYYLGRQYRLQVLRAKAQCVRLKGAFFYVSVRDPDNRKSVRDEMQAWYADHAKVLLLRRLELYIPYIRRRGVQQPIVRFRRMTNRWGSCSPKGTIMLNTELVKVSARCIDYVLVHELCHLLHAHHDDSFFKLMEVILPDWQLRKNHLEKSGSIAV